MAGFIQERQARQVRALRQHWRVNPKLAIVVTVDHPAIETYVRMKSRYGAELQIGVEAHRVRQSEAPALIERLNQDESVHGIIVQLPLERPEETDNICNLVAPAKDVDALGASAIYEPATPMAIMWLLAGYAVDLRDKHIVLVGRGKLVGRPLEAILRAQNLNVEVLDETTTDNDARIAAADVVISATGVPHLITADILKHGAIVVDAGVAGESGKTVGDLAPSVYDRDDLTITPTKGGVGPLTICALFDNVIRATGAMTEPSQ